MPETEDAPGDASSGTSGGGLGGAGTGGSASGGGLGGAGTGGSASGGGSGGAGPGGAGSGSSGLWTIAKPLNSSAEGVYVPEGAIPVVVTPREPVGSFYLGYANSWSSPSPRATLAMVRPSAEHRQSPARVNTYLK